MSAEDMRDPQAFAAEMVFGLLDREEHATAERQFGNDAPLRTAHRWWVELLPRLFDGQEVQPSPSLWGRVAASLPAGHRAPSATGRGWRSIAFTALAACLLLAIALGAELSRPQKIVQIASVAALPRLVAVLTNPGGKPFTLAVGYDPRSGGLSLAPKDIARGGGSLELWVIPADQRPRAVGLLPELEGTLVSAPQVARLIRADVILAVSREPVGGSPAEGPTGPIILKGPLVAL